MKYYLSRPKIDQNDIDSVVNVLRSPNLSLGPKINEFEQALAQYSNKKYCAVVNSGTSALHLALLAKNITKTSDEVIVPSFTFIATSNVVIHAGGTPIFVDADENSYNITPDTIMEKINSNTKAIIPVDVFGRPIDEKGIQDIAEDHSLFLLRDSCEALGTKVDGKHIGELSDAITFAFYPNKQITTGEGGALLTDDDYLIKQVASLRNQGRGDSTEWLTHDKIGFNYRMSDINAALGLSQLNKIEEIIDKKQRIVNLYNQAFSSTSYIKTPTSNQNERISWFVYTIQVDFNQSKLKNRDELVTKLKENGIQAGRYFSPVHLQPIYQKLYNYKSGDFPITEKLGEEVLALPFHLDLEKEHISDIVNTIISIVD
ncbi:MAG: DegT/DnrJ/EryC1/StrS family aminotransferase [Candidatus Heimdallarchaeota archaeon]|nr:DegT/DnrJ/EryC1/StrS family aminotransferase [Candidatus Heimdallarchaeota archaeon]MDH5647254.1 DegT/DnrJ/EryC1/StrS family aminotransferase [Candidatus Heimdallarchaeota archaeon]